MLKKLIQIIPIGLSIFVVMLVLVCAVFVKPEQVVLVQPVVNNDGPTPPTTPISTSDWEVYSNEKYGYEIKYPLDWIVETYEGKYNKNIKKPQEKADWISLALHTKDKQKIENYQESMIANINIYV